MENLSIIKEKLLKYREKILKEFEWPFLDEKPLSKKNANKFLLGAILDRQIKANIAWENAEKLSEELNDPENLWKRIIEDEQEFKRIFKEHRFHRFVNQMAEIIVSASKQISERFNGDAREIWKSNNPYEIKDKLLKISGIGEGIANMVIGGLWEKGHITTDEPLDVKPDLHVTRVLGRIVEGREISKEGAIELARKIHPEQPWLLDLPLFSLGQNICRPTNPNCEECEMKEICKFARLVGIIRKEF
jgi:endonuclease III